MEEGEGGLDKGGEGGWEENKSQVHNEGKVQITGCGDGWGGGELH